MILAIDGASSDLSIALTDPAGSLITDEGWTSAHRQSTELVPRIVGLLAAADRSVLALRAVAIGTGPGSFTGLRVAMSVAKGLALGLGIPIVGVPSLWAWLLADPEAAGAVARAGAREAYLLAREADEPVIVDRDALPDHSGGRRGALVAPTQLAADFDLIGTRPPRGAGAIARRAAERLASDPAGDDLHRLEPIYLRLPRGVNVERGERVRWL